jgi:hypothetical protein
MLNGLGARSRHRHGHPGDRGCRPAGRRHVPHLQRPHRGRLLHRPGRGHGRRDPHRGRGHRAPGLDAARVRAHGHPLRDPRQGPVRGRRPGARDPHGPGRPHPEGRRRAVAGVPGGPHVHRTGRRDAVPGTILIYEKMFESRMFFADKLISMGARIVLCDPHRAVVVGPSRLHAAPVESPDIRAGMALLIAALGARGHQPHLQCRPDRARLRADRRTAARPRREHRRTDSRGD